MLQIETLRAGIREVTHGLNNPLGVIRMAAYFLENSETDDEKRAHYFKVINESLDKVEENLKQLKALRENISNPLI